MDKMLETKFFDAYKFGGIVYRCLDWVGLEYGLPNVVSKDFKGSDKQGNAKEGCKEFADKPKLQRWHDAEAKAIVGAARGFDASTFGGWQSLFEEIENNLNECRTDAAKERYLFSLLTPFGDTGSGYSEALHPYAEINRLQGKVTSIDGISDYTKLMQLWQSQLQTDGRAKEQIDACKEAIAMAQRQIDYLKYKSKQLLLIIGTKEITDRAFTGATVEYYLRGFVGYANAFANRLDALLLAYGVDLLRLQRKCGIYLKAYREITDVADYVGSVELAQSYIDALPKPQQAEQPQQEQGNKQPQQGINLPVDLLKYKEQVDTRQARKYFAVAISKGIIEKTTDGYRKCSGISKAQLAYFLQCVYVDAKQGGTFPDAPLCLLFGETGLKQAANSIANNNTGKPRGGAKIDAIFEE